MSRENEFGPTARRQAASFSLDSAGLAVASLGGFGIIAEEAGWPNLLAFRMGNVYTLAGAETEDRGATEVEACKSISPVSQARIAYRARGPIDSRGQLARMEGGIPCADARVP